ncbi:DNA polymerase III subunit delta [Candidatus Saccharibacteria bacterium]|nr:DNA polymerase III subunit delta [Candidatus Saccharibacteria bacterium]
MLKVFVGENSFTAGRAIEDIIKNSDLTPERIDGETLRVVDLANVLMGGTLFAAQRLIIIRHLADNSVVWATLADYSDALKQSDNLVILVEPKLDKRSKTYKALAKIAEIREFTPLPVRDIAAQLKWLEAESKRMGLIIDSYTLRHLLLRVGHDQWRLVSALEKLKLKGEVNISVIDELIEPSDEQNIFAIFELAVNKRTNELLERLNRLELSEDPYMFFGILAGQMFLLASLKLSKHSPSTLAKNFAVHPFALSNMQSLANRMGEPQVKAALKLFNKTDLSMKTANLDPWLLVKSLLTQISNL